jgi:hypothetical protein
MTTRTRRAQPPVLDCAPGAAPPVCHTGSVQQQPCRAAVAGRDDLRAARREWN